MRHFRQSIMRARTEVERVAYDEKAGSIRLWDDVVGGLYGRAVS